MSNKKSNQNNNIPFPKQKVRYDEIRFIEVELICYLIVIIINIRENAKKSKTWGTKWMAVANA